MDIEIDYIRKGRVLHSILFSKKCITLTVKLKPFSCCLERGFYQGTLLIEYVSSQRDSTSLVVTVNMHIFSCQR